MSVVDTSGATVTKAALEAAGTTSTGETTYTFPNDYYEKFSYYGDQGHFESGKRLALHANVPYTQAHLDKLFDAAVFSSVSPAAGTAAGGTNVTINGSGFAGNVGVHFGANAATNVKVVDDNTITCTTPAGTAGATNIVINDDNGNVTATGAYTYQ